MRKPVSKLIPAVVCLILVGTLWLPSCEADRLGAPIANKLAYPAEDFSADRAYRVLKVVDGDTIKIEYEGRSATVRLIGVDTPETVHPAQPVEPYGKEASAFTTNLLTGESVYLRFGDEPRDKYNRLLAYAFRSPDGLFVNLEIVRQGYGHAYTKYPFQHMDLFRHYEARARQVGKGLWGLSSAAVSQSETKQETGLAEDVTVYVTRSGSKYHTASCKWGNIPMSLSDARKGYTPCGRCNPP